MQAGVHRALVSLVHPPHVAAAPNGAAHASLPTRSAAALAIATRLASHSLARADDTALTHAEPTAVEDEVPPPYDAAADAAAGPEVPMPGAAFEGSAAGGESNGGAVYVAEALPPPSAAVSEPTDGPVPAAVVGVADGFAVGPSARLQPPAVLLLTYAFLLGLLPLRPTPTWALFHASTPT